MIRRDFVAGLAGLGAVAPFASRAESPRPPRIGALFVDAPEPSWSLFRAGLGALGYFEGRTIGYELRSAGGDPARLPGLAAELARLRLSVIVAWQTPAIQAAKQATATIPIVMAISGDPVGTGLIASLARPGGNVTGLSSATTELAGKTLELLREIIPGIGRVAVLANAADPFSRPFSERLRATAAAMRLELAVHAVQSGENLEAAFAAMRAARAEAVVAQPSIPHRAVVALALQHRLPAVAPSRPFAEAGGLAAVGVALADAMRKAALYVDKILKGAKPADLPVEQPTRFETVVNLKTARALGLTLPHALLGRADEVIE